MGYLYQQRDEKQRKVDQKDDRATKESAERRFRFDGSETRNESFREKDIRQTGIKPDDYDWQASSFLCSYGYSIVFGSSEIFQAVCDAWIDRAYRS